MRLRTRSLRNAHMTAPCRESSVATHMQHAPPRILRGVKSKRRARIMTPLALRASRHHRSCRATAACCAARQLGIAIM